MRRCYRLIAVRSASGVMSLEEVQAVLAYQRTAQCKMSCNITALRGET